MRAVVIILAVLLPALTGAAHAQAVGEPVVSAQDQMVIFAGFAVAAAAVFVYLARDIILRRKTEYDGKHLGSKEDREYEKYHSDWSDDYEDIGSRSRSRERLRRMLDEGEDLPDLYSVMGVDRDATQEQIKRQYRRLAKEIHPDRSRQDDAKERMAQLNRAYEILSDPEQRSEYDTYMSG